ncbi:MAG TPA: transcriptional activator RfaH [Steroidobacteraceae bacterium]|nr:transcriptional activator RfaH [Steroidobacteraceae bacterium]
MTERNERAGLFAGSHALFEDCLPTTEAARSWFLIHTKPAGERLTQVNLLRQGFKVYFPRLLRRTLHRGRWRERIGALFPRYVFVQVETERQSLAPVRSTVGVTAVVRFGAQLATVPHSLVSGLMAREEPGSGLHRLRQRPLHSGMRVSIISGALCGLDGIFDREAGQERAVILLSLLGRSTPVCVDQAALSRQCA